MHLVYSTTWLWPNLGLNPIGLELGWDVTQTLGWIQT